MIRILVTGGQGQVGSALAELGAELGLRLIALSRDLLDICDADAIARAFSKYQPELLINAAAYTAVDKAESEPGLAYAINDSAAGLLADACVALNIPMFHISTDYVFDGLKDGLYTENDLVNPQAVYACSKVAGERAIRERIAAHIILRTSWVFGGEGHNFVNTIIRLAKDRNTLTVVADQFGGPTSARAIAEALLTIAIQYESGKNVEWGTYHFSQKPYVSWHQFATEIIRVAHGKGMLGHSVILDPISDSELSTLVKRPANSRLDTAKIERVFGVVPGNWWISLDSVISHIDNK